MDLLVVVPALLCLLLRRPTPQRFLDIDLGILAADHETDLARWIRGNSGEPVLGDREDFAAGFLNVLDQVEVEPLVFS